MPGPRLFGHRVEFASPPQAETGVSRGGSRFDRVQHFRAVRRGGEHLLRLAPLMIEANQREAGKPANSA
jgi:hypothetical protein